MKVDKTVDTISKRLRSQNMSRIRSKNTAPEILVRSVLHRMGFRFRLHDKTLPGCPDIVLKRWKTVVLVNGCFWHRHKNCRYAYVPKTRIAFWNKKFAGNMKRDAENVKALKRLGWKVKIVWECELRNTAGLESRLHKLRL
jgi:DNA mismatch endonuclease (patch repair protein)